MRNERQAGFGKLGADFGKHLPVLGFLAVAGVMVEAPYPASHQQGHGQKEKDTEQQQPGGFEGHGITLT